MDKTQGPGTLQGLHQSFQSRYEASQARRAAREAHTLKLARVIDTPRGDLVRLLKQGKARSLQEAIASLPSSQEKILAHRLGEHREALEQLSGQANPHRFYKELYSVARAMERGSQGETAYLLYDFLGKEAGVPKEAARRARHRIKVMGGKGGFVDQMEVFADHAGEVLLDKPMWGAMALAPLGAGLGRLWGLGRAARWGLMGRKAAALKYAGHFGGEVFAFSTTATGLRVALGEAGGLTAQTYLEELEKTGWLFGGIHVGRGIGMLLSRRMGNMGQAVFAQGGVGFGIGLGNFVQMKRGYLGELSLAELAGGAGAQWIQFSLAGGLVRKATGRYLRPLELKLAGKIRARELKLNYQEKGLGEYWQGTRDVSKQWGQKAGERMDRLGERLFPHAKDLRSSLIFSMEGTGNGNGSGEFPRSTGRRPTGETRAPAVENVEELKQRIDKIGRFIQGKLGIDVQIQLGKRFPIAVAVNKAIHLLDGLPNHSEIPRNRTVTLITSEMDRFPLLKTKDGFQLVNPQSTQTRNIESDRPTPDISMPTSFPGALQFRPSDVIPLVGSLETIRIMIQTASSAKVTSGETVPIILEGKSGGENPRLNVENLVEYSAGLGKSLPERTGILLVDLEAKTIFQGERSEENVIWKPSAYDLWREVNRRTSGSHARVQSPTEVYLALRILTEREGPPAGQGITLDYEGRVQGDVFEKLMKKGLSYFGPRLKTDSLEVNYDLDHPPLRFLRKGRDWEMVSSVFRQSPPYQVAAPKAPMERLETPFGGIRSVKPTQDLSRPTFRLIGREDNPAFLTRELLDSEHVQGPQFWVRDMDWDPPIDKVRELREGLRRASRQGLVTLVDIRMRRIQLFKGGGHQGEIRLVERPLEVPFKILESQNPTLRARDLPELLILISFFKAGKRVRSRRLRIEIEGDWNREHDPTLLVLSLNRWNWFQYPEIEISYPEGVRRLGRRADGRWTP